MRREEPDKTRKKNEMTVPIDSEIWKSKLLIDHKNISHGSASNFYGRLCNGTGITPEIQTNRKLLAKHGNFDFFSITMVKQSHGNKVLTVSENIVGNGVAGMRNDLPDADGMVTNLENAVLIVKSNDCVPIILFDPRKKVIGAVHAGWKGVVGNIVKNAIQAMHSEFSSKPENIIAVLGPSIRSCHYDISNSEDDRVNVFRKAFYSNNSIVFERDGKIFVDLASGIQFQLVDCGLKKENIDICPDCTYEMNHKWPSRRANIGNPTGIATWSFISLIETT